MLRGGLPKGRTTLVFGGPGCGKTVLALQTLVRGIDLYGEPGIFVAFEEPSRQVLENAASFGWNLSEKLRKQTLSVIDASLSPDVVRAGKFDTSGILAALGARVKEMRAKRVVLDGLDVLLTLLDDPAAERRELHRIHDWLLRQELTGILTAKSDSSAPFAQTHYGFAAHMADCALLLTRRHEHVVSERDLTVLKYRGSTFFENRAPFVIGRAGIEVAAQTASRSSGPPQTERLSTGVPRLDTMLSGGYFRAASVLLTGLPGTAKSTLAGAFIEAACRRKERALYVTFDEQCEDTVRNLGSIGIRVKPFLDSGHLKMMSAMSITESAEVQLMRIRTTIQDHRARCVVIDPLSALAKSSDPSLALSVLARFIHWSKVNGITMLGTSLLSGPDPHVEATELGISTLSDTWIHLAYAQRGGERNRALTIIKSRGTGHSNQVRELILSDDGIALADVYQSGGEVFMGTRRWEQENAERDAERLQETTAAKRRLELERLHADTRARAESLQRDLEMLQQELKEAQQVEADRVARNSARHTELMSHRHADAEKKRSSKPSALGARKRNMAGAS